MKKERVIPYMLYLVVAVCMVGLIVRLLGQTVVDDKMEPAEAHFAILIPAQDSEESGVRAAIRLLAEEYHLDMEVHEFATVAEQKQMLRLLPSTEVDGVLLWPLSTDDADYEKEITKLQEMRIPVVVVERDVAQEQRNSFIGSGTSSDLLVLNQRVKDLQTRDCFIVGNRSGNGSSQMVELVIFQRGEWANTVLKTLPQDKKLRQLTQEPPEGYVAVESISLMGEDARSLQLKRALTDLFYRKDDLKLFFSLDEDLSTAAVSAKRSMGAAEQGDLQLLCYGEIELYRESLESGILDGLVTSRPDVSVTVGIRYLRDICRDFWVPEAMDSGIDFLTAGTA